MEVIAGLLLGIKVHPLVQEIPLEELPTDKVGRGVVFILGKF